MIHIFIITLLFTCISSIMGFTQGLIYTGKKWKAFIWDEHIIYNLERGIWTTVTTYFLYLGQILEFKSFVHFIIFCIGICFSFTFQYSFWQNGFLNLVYRWTKVYDYTFFSTNDPKNGVWNLNFPTRLLFWFVGVALLFPLFHYCIIK